MQAKAFRNIIWPMAVAETIMWASSYYLFPSLLPIWEVEFGWSKSELSGALTLALLLSAISAPFAGKLIDHGYGAKVFTGSAMLLALSLLGLSQVQNLVQFYLAWLGIGIAMAGGLYEACFAIITRCFGHDSKRAITIVTLVAGFAGTISFPLVSALSSSFGWRMAVMNYAVFVALVAVPLLWRTCHQAENYPHAKISEDDMDTISAGGALRHLSFWFLGATFFLLALDHSMIITHLFPILADREIHSQAAILAASMIGPMQVAGRLTMMIGGKNTTTAYIALGCSLGMCLAALSLFGASIATGLVVAFVILQGASMGMTSILRPVMVGEWIGRRNFGAISGMLAVPYLIGHSIAPSVSAAVWGWGGYDKVLILASVLAGIAFFTIFAAWHFSPKR